MISSRALIRIGHQVRPQHIVTRLRCTRFTAPSISAPKSRLLSQSLPTLRKRRNDPEDEQPTSKSSSAADSAPEDPLDFSSLISAYAPIDTHFRAQLSTIAHGGRFNPDHLGSLNVPVKVDGEDMGSFPLRELAQVVPRSGRTISLLVNDREYIKPIMSAVQSSPDFNQQPQRSEDNDLELLLRVEMQRKDEVLRRIKETAQAWRDRVRQARAKHDKQIKDWKKAGTILPDVAKRADKELQKLQDKKIKEIDGEETQTVRALDRN
ncbi:hypothetical protein VHEMI04948 [[Torrubiella] hemipterigena]|uniref:Ribosome recycling factor domain-containing protein n=1 Tax=[Torrubiella] hemipterigena TaxID=1531966 RepID=A0A0A1TFC7_9HYPO|nr:hypothetical protein VHEMI04948 [[Torrubiella] hemipterigena]